MAFSPEDRMEQAAIPQMKIFENVALNNFKSSNFFNNGLINEKKIKEHSQKILSDFSVNTYSLKIKYNHSINLLNSLYLQYNEAERKLITNVRINIIHAPLSDLFLVYSEIRDVDNTNSKSGYIALKLTKLFGI